MIELCARASLRSSCVLEQSNVRAEKCPKWRVETAMIFHRNSCVLIGLGTLSERNAHPERLLTQGADGALQFFGYGAYRRPSL
jgi:hypothetical protein